MKALTILMAAVAMAALDAAFAADRVRVRGHFRKDGTYVQPHYRTAPDGRFYNNWSSYGNINPYTGEVGKELFPRSTAPRYTIPSFTVPAPATGNGLAPAPTFSVPLSDGFSSSTDFLERAKARDVGRARYWKERGFDFDPSFMSAFMMDAKVRDIERAKYWKEKGYSFNADYMTAFMMDAKVRDIERAKHWAERGYQFNPDYMTAFMMDAKVRDIERAKYWKDRGFNFNPDYMTAFMMDAEARRMANQTVQRTGASRSAQDTDQTSSAAGSRR